MTDRQVQWFVYCRMHERNLRLEDVFELDMPLMRKVEAMPTWQRNEWLASGNVSVIDRLAIPWHSRITLFCVCFEIVRFAFTMIL